MSDLTYPADAMQAANDACRQSIAERDAALAEIQRLREEVAALFAIIRPAVGVSHRELEQSLLQLFPVPDVSDRALEGVQAIARERVRQITDLGYDEEHDKHHPVEHLVSPAVVLLGGRPVSAPVFTVRRADPDSGYYQRDDLVRAGALIAAAIDRLDADERSKP